jgi:hypothetical protein
MNRPVKSQWDTYRAILPKDAGSIQVFETRRAFYAGAHALFYLILNKLEPTTPDEEPTENDMKLMDDIDQELRAFAVDIKNGVA